MILSLAAAIAAASCTPVVGADLLWQPAIRWVLVGEIHGTNETPDAFTNLVCLAAATGRPVTVALEYSADGQAVIDTYLASDGGPAAQTALLALPVWNAPMQDGRGSTAVLRMLNRLREMRQAGTIAGVIAADVGAATPAEPTRDAAMARTWRAIAVADNGLVLALVGNVHAMRRPMLLADRTIETAGSLMPAARTLTINVVGEGGQAWSCQADGCGVHGNGRAQGRSAAIVAETDTESPFDATYTLGIATTAAVPANPLRAAPRKMPIRVPGS